MNEDLDNFDEFDEFADDEEYFDEMTAEAVVSFVKAASKSANKLTKLIIENNRHNSVKMTTEDIYATYNESFGVAMATIAKYGLTE